MAFPLLLLGAVALGALAVAASSASAKPSPAPPPPPRPPGGLTPAEQALLVQLEPSTRAFVLQVLDQARAQGLAPRLTSGRRSCAEQNRLYAQGRSTPGQIVTHARGCRSWHVAGRAVDFSLPNGTAQQYAQVGAIAKSLGGKWGGDFPGFMDQWHLEYHPNLTIEQVCPDPDNCKDT